MASGVSVQSSAVSGGIGCCKTSIIALETAAGGLKRSYQKAGADGWRDSKYTALGTIVQECVTALNKPVSELQQCQKSLETLLEIIRRYEDQKL